jgi:hypothetical protein
MSAALKRALGWVEGQLKTRPFVFNCASAGTITCLGDIIAQNGELNGITAPLPGANAAAAAAPSAAPTDALACYRSTTYEWRRTLLIGGFVAATTPFWLGLYKVGDRLFQGKASMLRACQQGFFTWCCGTCFTPVFVAYMTVSSAVVIHNVRDAAFLRRCVEERLRKNYLTHAAVAFCFWSVQWIPIFYWMPPHLRLLYVSTLQVFWNSIVSYIQHRN